MRYFIVLLLLMPAWYLISYARYEWKNNRIASIGSVVLAIFSVAFPTVMLFIR